MAETAAQSAWRPIIEPVTLPDGYVIRQLSPAEWHRVTEAGGSQAILSPEAVAAVIAILSPENIVVGHVTLALSVIAGDLFFADSIRHHAQLSRAFLGAFYTLLIRDEIPVVYALSDATDPDAQRRLELLGFPVQPYTVHMAKAGGQ